MTDLLICIAIITGTELLSIAIFITLVKVSKSKKKVSPGSIFKGIFERSFIVFSLISGYPQALTLFAALKIATRIKDDDRISNDYYLVGNLISVSLAIMYTLILKNLLNL